MTDRGAVRRESVQGELFAHARVVLRRMPATGATVRLRLEPLGGGLVRVVEAARRSAGASAFKDLPGEVGRVVRFEQLGLDTAYARLFGDEA
ncbi:hypothetical protein BH23DEI1_BH23DEI1_04070 [soil metagenome]